jgi:hypothetical protein
MYTVQVIFSKPSYKYPSRAVISYSVLSLTGDVIRGRFLLVLFVILFLLLVICLVSGTTGRSATVYTLRNIKKDSSSSSSASSLGPRDGLQQCTLLEI